MSASNERAADPGYRRHMFFFWLMVAFTLLICIVPVVLYGNGDKTGAGLFSLLIAGYGLLLWELKRAIRDLYEPKPNNVEGN